MRRGTNNARHEGVVSVEYVAAGSAIIALLLALALSGVGARIADAFENTICKAVSAVDGRACSTRGGEESAAPGDLSGLSPRERAEAGDVVGVGDSYMSGEGIRDYTKGTDIDFLAKERAKRLQKALKEDGFDGFTKEAQKLKDSDEKKQNYCHRSDGAWVPGIYNDGNFKGDLKFVACSGATTKQYDEASTKNYGEDAQKNAIDNDTTLVLVSLGGNDAHFSDVIKNCVKPNGNGCGSEKSDTVMKDLDDAANELYDRYVDMKSRAHPGGRIVVVGYPRLFPIEDDDANGSDSGISRDEQRWLNEMGDYANNKIKEAAARGGVEYVDISNALEGHEIGSDDPWINDLDYGNGPEDASPGAIESFHPKRKGHNAIRAIVNKHLDSGS